MKKINKTIKQILCVSAVPGLLGFSMHAFSDDTLKPVIITASRIEENTNSLPSNTTVITAEDIEKSSARTIPELLSQHAGVHTTHLYGNNAARVSIDVRGFGAASKANTLILIDGRRLNDIDLSAVDLTSVPLQNIERVEIIRGGGSVLYGEGAVGGSINIITKRHGKAGTTGYASITAGSENSDQVDIGVTHVKDDFSVNLAASAIRSDGYRDHNGFRQGSLQVDVRQLIENGEVFFKFGADEQSLQAPGNRLVDPNVPVDELNDDRQGSSKPDDYADSDGKSFTMGMTRYLSDDTELIVDLGYRNKNSTAFLELGDFSSYVDTDLSSWSLTPRVKIKNQLFSLPGTLIAGLDYYVSSYDSIRAQRLEFKDQPYHLLDLSQTSTGIYMQQIIEARNNVRINAGVRLQRVKTDASDVFDVNAPGASMFDSEAPGGSNSDTETGAELGVSYDVSDATTMYAGYNRAFRIATVDETFATFPGVFNFLEPQTSDSIDFGIKFAGKRLSAQAGVYYMKLENEIHFDPNAFSNVNLDPTRRFGIEVSTGLQVASDLKLDANFAITKAEFDDGVFDGNEVPLVPEQTANVTAFWDINSSMLLTTTVNYVGDRRFDNDQLNTFAKIPSYTTADIKLTAQFSSWKLSGQVNNMFDEKYFENGVISTFTPGRYVAYPLPEREIRVSLEKRF